MDLFIKCIAILIVVVIIGAVSSIVGEIVWCIFRWIEKRLHPEQCPLCKMDIEHLDTCFGCPFVVVDEWLECECGDCGYKEPCSCHCGLKDKKFIQHLKDEQAKKLIEKL